MAPFLLLFAALLMTEAWTRTDRFESQCASASQYGWPRFASRKALEADKKWASYFQRVYGELPDQYPVCMYDFWHIDKDAYIASGLNSSRSINMNASSVTEGDLYAQISTTGYELAIYHADWEPLPNNTWIEVTHAVYPTELSGCWVWRQRGSGIWYNTGRTIVFPTPSDPKRIHADAISFLSKGCSVNISREWPQLESDVFGGCAREVMIPFSFSIRHKHHRMYFAIEHIERIRLRSGTKMSVAEHSLNFQLNSA